MHALRLIAHGAPGQFVLQDLPIPEPQEGEVLVRIHSCGLNHLDLWLEEKGLPMPIALPRTPGCEAAGEVARLGPKTRGWKVGERVCIASNLCCGACEGCRDRKESLCVKNQIFGVDRDGGFAEFVALEARHLVRLPEDVTYETAAALTLAGSTAMHMLTDRVEVRSKDWVLVIGGASGVGSAAIQIARNLGGRVIALASSEPKRTLCSSLGAEFVLDSNDPQWAREVRQLTGKRGVDVVVEHVGGDTFLRALDCLARGGSIVTCGATAGREIQLNLWPLFVKQQRLIGSYGRNRADLERTLEWAESGKLKPVIDRIFQLKDAPKAFEALRQRQVLGKVLINP